MPQGFQVGQVVAVILVLIAPLALLGIAAIKWGVYTSGERTRIGELEV